MRNREKLRAKWRRAYKRKYLIIYARNKDKPWFLYKTYKHKAKQKNIYFALTKEQFMTFWQKPCYYCGTKIKTIGLDRKNNHKGYLIDNIVPCCKHCNSSKYNKTFEEFVLSLILG